MMDEARDFYSDEERDSLDTMEEIAIADDKLKFLTLVKGLSKFEESRNGKLYICPSEIFLEICDNGAVNCATALLEGETGWVVDLNVPFKLGLFPLHCAADNFCIPLIELFLCHGARTDVRTSGECLRVGLLPLNVALEKLCYHEYLVDWTPKQSIFKLVTILSLPQMKVPLEANRLLAWSTEEACEVLYWYAKDGRLIEMAALLMVAREKLAPILFPPSRDFIEEYMSDGFRSDGRLSIRQCIKDEIASLVGKEIILRGNGRSTKLVRLYKEKKETMVSALMLLEVFEKAGDAIEAYLQSDRTIVTKEKVVEDVKCLLVKAGFALKDKDTDLSNINWIQYNDESLNVKSASKELESTATFSSQQHDLCMPLLSPRGGFPNVKRPMIGIHEQKWSLSFFPFWAPIIFSRSATVRPFSSMGFEYECPRTLEEFINGGLAAQKYKQCVQSSKKLTKFAEYAYFALAMKKGIRRG